MEQGNEEKPVGLTVFTPISIEGVDTFALYFFNSERLLLSKLHFEHITVIPVAVQLAPIVLVNMLNTGGAIQSLVTDEEKKSVEFGGRGGGEMRVFAWQKPRGCLLDGKDSGAMVELVFIHR